MREAPQIVTELAAEKALTGGAWVKVFVGEYFGELLFVPVEHAELVEKSRVVLVAVRAGHTRDVLEERFGEEQVASVLDPLIAVHWSNNEANTEQTEDPADGYEVCLSELCDLEAWYDAIWMLDDADALGEVLPEAVMARALYPETSPMTGYDPVRWDKSDRDDIEAMLQAAGFEVLDGAEAFARAQELYLAL